MNGFFESCQYEVSLNPFCGPHRQKHDFNIIKDRLDFAEIVDLVVRE